MNQYQQQRRRNSPPLVANEARPRSGTLYFSAFVQKDSQIGGCAWRVLDINEVQTITEGSEPVVQDNSSLMRMELEGLLNGLKAAFTKKLRSLIIKSNSVMIVNQLLRPNDSVTNFFENSDSHCIRDLTSAIRKLLPQFHHIESYLISTEENIVAYNRASKAIFEYYNKKFDKLVERKINTDLSLNSLITSPKSVTMGASQLSPFQSPSRSSDPCIPLNLSQLSLSNNLLMRSTSASSVGDLTDRELSMGPSSCCSVSSAEIDRNNFALPVYFLSDVSSPPSTDFPLALHHPQPNSDLAEFELLSPHTQVHLLLAKPPMPYLYT